jgi:dihydroorotase
MYIDPHVHFRDFNQRNKETIAHGLEVARDSGVDAVCDMPNTNPAILTEKEVLERIELARQANVKEVRYFIWMGLTNDPEQVKRAVDLERKFSEVIGMKVYMGHSTGDMGIVEYHDQEHLLTTLARAGYEGILPTHCEKENEMHNTRFDRLNPITHCLDRAEIAEVRSVRDLLTIYRSISPTPKYKLHIAHISSPEAVKLVSEAREIGIDISCGVTPHHLFYDWHRMFDSDGLVMKMNPPLRGPGKPERMLELLKNGEIDFIETDHAPHTYNDKLGKDPCSGIPALANWPLFEALLIYKGFSEKRIQEVLFDASRRRLGIEDVTYRPSSATYLKSRTRDYPFNAFKPLEEKIKFELIDGKAKFRL